MHGTLLIFCSNYLTCYNYLLINRERKIEIITKHVLKHSFKRIKIQHLIISLKISACAFEN